ncbi:tRNA pseudouridine(55) synthase, partial [bacterium]|nr:tRNA pseudouridine(55) synthase [bacterium]
VEREARKVRIYESSLLRWDKPFLHFRIRCGKGTYIRAIARDIGQVLGTGGTLKALTRTRVGPYAIEDALSMEKWKELCFVHESLSNP